MAPTIVSFINMKGGVGKTTASFNLAWYAAYHLNRKVLVVDLDPQSNMSQYMMSARPYLDHIQNNRLTIVNIFEQFSAPTALSGGAGPLNAGEAIYEVVNWEDNSCLHLVPSRLELAWTLKNPTSKDHLLAKFLAEHANSYDFVFIDCAPTESILTLAAYRASRYVTVPVKPEFLAAIGLPLLVRSLAEFKQSFGQHELDLVGIFFTDSDPHFAKPEQVQGRQDVEELAASNNWYVFKKELRHSDSYPRGARDGQPIFRTKHAREWVVNEFRAFGKEFMERLEN